jgi:hypothetical protein
LFAFGVGVNDRRVVQLAGFEHVVDRDPGTLYSLS